MKTCFRYIWVKYIIITIIIITIIITVLYYKSVSDVQRMLSVHKLQ